MGDSDELTDKGKQNRLAPYYAAAIHAKCQSEQHPGLQRYCHNVQCPAKYYNKPCGWTGPTTLTASMVTSNMLMVPAAAVGTTLTASMVTSNMLMVPAAAV